MPATTLRAAVHAASGVSQEEEEEEEKGKLSRACHLRVKETTEMDISERRARRSPQKKKNKQHIISSFHT